MWQQKKCTCSFDKSPNTTKNTSGGSWAWHNTGSKTICFGNLSGISDGALIVPVPVIFVLKDADHGISIGIVVPIGLQGCSLGLASQFQLLLPLGQLQVQHPPQQVGQAVQTIDQTQERYSTGVEKGQRLE